MSEAFIGEIKMYSYNFPPRNWAQCNGQLLPIAQNQALFSLLGTTYGGNGQVNFALPNLQGRTPIHRGPGGSFPQGQIGGSENVTLNQTQIPAHQHNLVGSSNGSSQGAASGGSLPTLASGNAYDAPGAASGTITPTTATGGNQGHPNLQPYLVVNICICLFGIFPSRN